MMWTIIIGGVLFILYMFSSELNKDNADLNIGIDNKFDIIVTELNNAAFRGLGSVRHTSRREFNLYKDPSNQIILFHYGTGILTIEWHYKYFQKAVVHKKIFREVRNLSIFEQQNIAILMITEMQQVIINHQRSVLGSVDSEEELLQRLQRIIANQKT